MSFRFPNGPQGVTDSQQATADGWITWSPRAEIAPQFRDEPGAGRAGGRALAIHGGGNSACLGAWRRRWEVVGGRPYRFTAYYRTLGVAHPHQSVLARLDWRDASDERIRQPDHARETFSEGEWTRMEYAVAAPEDAKVLELELALARSADGTVWWSGITLQEEPSLTERVVRTVTIHHYPRNTQSTAESVGQFCRLVEAAAPHNPDLICLPEGMTIVGTGLAYHEVGESVPGPTTEALGALAKSLRCYIAGGLYEQVGDIVYNTAFLLDRDGAIVGTYRKTHLPREEVEGGLMPGDSYPVFQTDFGKVGLLICWDLQFPEPARAMALQGAEILLLPIWGGIEALAYARAIENHCYLVTSAYDFRSFILDPSGQIMAEATASDPIACAEITLDRPLFQPWIGDMRTRTWKERRSDIALEPIITRP